MPKKQRIEKPFLYPELTDTQVFAATDGRGGDPDGLDRIDYLTYGFPTVAECREPCFKLWKRIGDQVLAEWVVGYPGTRPNYWWEFSSPRMSEGDLERRWRGAYFAARLYEPRQRFAGIGEADFERYPAVVPVFKYGVPANWASIDLGDPPVYESEASYLRRSAYSNHGNFHDNGD
jgi:hypothetical protein